MKKILIQLDTDSQASVFDQVVAFDAGVEHIISIGNVTPDTVEAHVHGAMFTRGGEALKNTAIFVGGSQVDKGEAVFEKVKKTFFGPFRNAVMMDSNGSNTTSAAVVRRIASSIDLQGKKAMVLAGTGPVGIRTATLLSREGCQVSITSRSSEKAAQVCDQMKADWGVTVTPHGVTSPEELASLLQEVDIIVAAGGAGVVLLPQESWKYLTQVKVLADVNAVPPLGIEGSQVMDKGEERDGKLFYGAIAIGNVKMKIHQRCVGSLFESNKQVLGLEEIYNIAKGL